MSPTFHQEGRRPFAAEDLYFLLGRDIFERHDNTWFFARLECGRGTKRQTGNRDPVARSRGRTQVSQIADETVAWIDGLRNLLGINLNRFSSMRAKLFLDSFRDIHHVDAAIQDAAIPAVEHHSAAVFTGISYPGRCSRGKDH